MTKPRMPASFAIFAMSSTSMLRPLRPGPKPSGSRCEWMSMAPFKAGSLTGASCAAAVRTQARPNAARSAIRVVRAVMILFSAEPSSVAMLGETNVEPSRRARVLHAVVDAGWDEDDVADFDLTLDATAVLAVDFLAARHERSAAFLNDPDVDRVLVELGAVLVGRGVLDVADVDVVEAALEQPDDADLLLRHLRVVRSQLLLGEVDGFVEWRLVEKEPPALRRRRHRQDAESTDGQNRKYRSHRFTPEFVVRVVSSCFEAAGKAAAQDCL